LLMLYTGSVDNRRVLKGGINFFVNAL